MDARPVVEGIQWVGAIDWDRRLFDELIPLPDGTSYNAYLVRGSHKTALIDSVDPSSADTLLSRLASRGRRRSTSLSRSIPNKTTRARSRVFSPSIPRRRCS